MLYDLLYNLPPNSDLLLNKPLYKLIYFLNVVEIKCQFTLDYSLLQSGTAGMVDMLVVLLLYVHGKHLRSFRAHTFASN